MAQSRLLQHHCFVVPFFEQERMTSLERLRRDVDKQRRTSEKKFKRHEAKVGAGRRWRAQALAYFCGLPTGLEAFFRFQVFRP